MINFKWIVRLSRLFLLSFDFTSNANQTGLYFDGKEDTTRRESNGKTTIGKQSNYTLVSQPEGKHFGFCVPDESTGN